MTPKLDIDHDALAEEARDKDSLHRVSRQLCEDIRDIRETPNGYEFLLSADSAPILRIIQVLNHGHLSFRFMRVEATVGPETGMVWVRVKGCGRVREFLRNEVLLQCPALT